MCRVLPWVPVGGGPHSRVTQELETSPGLQGPESGGRANRTTLGGGGHESLRPRPRVLRMALGTAAHSAAQGAVNRRRNRSDRG